jgi:hypothetical protein
MNDRLAKIARDAVIDAYKRGFDAGYNAAVTQQVEAEQEQLGIEFMQAKKAVAEVLLAGVMDDPVVQDFAKLRTAVYQGRNRLCACCGQPIGDNPVQYGGMLYCAHDCERKAR